ncbi:hypothetical protein TSUD_275070 [Trifolium subterraneum]|uniref:Ubiquitin-like protease family profile domain-containing protein n=1 Tax=Trifolium subterraneum TaxID=3900 RepID=A0A2Z6NCC4_TRISU|nr:hypothetical protein TSUD_275070 [Trifolium subterraneum]
MAGSPTERQTGGSDFEEEFENMANQNKTSTKEVETTLEKLLASPVSSCKHGHGEEVMQVSCDVVKKLIEETMKLCKCIQSLETSNREMFCLLDKMAKVQQHQEKSGATMKGKEVVMENVNLKSFEPHKHVGSATASSLKQPSLKGVSTVLLSDDDNTDLVTTKQTTYFKGSGSGSLKGAKRVGIVRDDPIGNITRRSEWKENEDEDAANISKKLAFTPSPKNIFKRTKCGGPQTKSPSFSPSYVNYAGSGSNTFKTNPSAAKVPKNFKCKFRTNPKMKLSKLEAIVCAYVFADTSAPNAPPTHHSDLVFNMETYFALRSDFECFVPGGIIGRNIITMTAMYVTWNQKQTISKQLWCLPPNFAMDVANGTNITELRLNYAHDWMPAIPCLKLIYVPIVDDNHWFLMVIKLDEKKVYHLDTNLMTHKVEPRRKIISRVCDAVSQIALSLYDGEVPYCAFPQFDEWDIVEPRGIPQCGHSLNSGLWVTEWINMQNAFNNQIISMMDETWARMKIAMRLLLGAHNECKDMLVADANQYWHDVMEDVYAGKN